MTPEGKVKDKVKAVLAAYVPFVYGNWIVQNGMGTPTLDYIGCCCGLYFSIETKAPGEKPTLRQQRTLDDIELADGKVFVIDNGDPLALAHLNAWLHALVSRKIQDLKGE